MRSAAAAARAVLIVWTLLVSQAGGPMSGSPGSRVPRSASASASPGRGEEHADAGGHRVLDRPSEIAVDETLGPLVDRGFGPRPQLAGEHVGDAAREDQALEQEFEASRLAPCTPEQATSPVA